MSVSLSEHLPLLAEAPDGIKKLRGLILELGVRGKLVPQDPKDEPASELLKRIAAEKARLVAEGAIRQGKPRAEMGEDEMPFVLPAGWVWLRLPEVAHYRIGKTPPTKDSKYWSDDGIPWVSISDMEQYGEVSVTSRGVTESAVADVFKYAPVSAGTLLMSFKLTVGKVSVLGVDAYHNEAIISVTPFKGIAKDFLFRFLPLIAQGGRHKNALMGNTLNSESMAELAVPVPPEPEQHRIVAKVDELMALCDRMAAEQADAEAAHTTLAQTLLGTLTQSHDAAELAANWQRLSQHFDTLFTTEKSLDALKQTVLQLAVMGKLVPQDPSDEPASELFKRIAAEKARLVAEGKIRKDKPLPQIGEEEKPFALPARWDWVRLADLLPEFQNGVSSRGDAGGEQVIVLRLADIKGGAVSLADTRQLLIEPSSISRYRLEEGDILIVRVNGSADIVGRFVVVEDVPKLIYCDHFIRLRISHGFISPRFLSLVAASKLVRDKISDLFITTAGQKTVNQGHIGSLAIPLVSITEQHRIVAKVDELMSLCDSLKVDLAESRARQARLATTLIESALEAA